MAVALAGAPRTFLVCAGLLWLSACATAASPDKMSVTAGSAPAVAEGARGYRALRVGLVGGGEATNPIWMSAVANDDLRAAIETSLRGLGYLAADPAKGSYEVTADIADLDRPLVSKDPAFLVVPVDLSVTIKIHYAVRPVGGGRAVFDDTVAATGTATASDAIIPDDRIRKANEAAVRANIQTFITRLEGEWR